MGVTFTLIAADHDQIGKISTEQWDDLQVFMTKMLDPAQLNLLFSLIDPSSPDIDAWDAAPLYEEEEVWLYELPVYFVDKLAHMSQDERQSLAQQWMQTGELDLFYTHLTHNEKTTDIAKLVDEICAFVRTATADGKPVLLYVSL